MKAVRAACAMLGLLCGCAVNQGFLRLEVANQAEKTLGCPSSQIDTHCTDSDCYHADATGCGRTIQYAYLGGTWKPVGPPIPAASPALVGSEPEHPGSATPPAASNPSADSAGAGGTTSSAPASEEQSSWWSSLKSLKVDWGSSAKPTAAPSPAPAVLPSPAASAKPGPIPGAPQPTAYAVIIGVEKYPGLPAATGARTDAELFAQVARTSLGIPANHVHLLLDAEASRARIERDLAWAAGSVPSGGRVYFFFSGHGAPEPTGRGSYLVPVDGDPQYLAQTALTLDDTMARIRQSKAKESIFFVDACFSGVGPRSVLAPGLRPIVRLKAAGAPDKVALFTASGPDEVSGAANQGQGGLFSSYLLRGLGRGAADLNGDGQITLRELADYVGPRVTREAAGANRAQNPSLKMGDKLAQPGELVLAWGLPPE